jgi:transcriptional regulator with XRE-family HTH domain
MMHLYGVLASMKRKKVIPAYRLAFGQAIRKRRIEMVLSQENLAESVGCHRNYMGRIERGEQNITLDMMVRVARGLKSPLSDLIANAGI